MLIFAASLFAFSLLAMAALFALKYREAQGGFLVAPRARAWADYEALVLKELMTRSHFEFAKVVPALLFLFRYGIHELALGVAALARFLERQAHKLADMVSHKHRFERRESKSEFLKKVSEFREGKVE